MSGILTRLFERRAQEVGTPNAIEALLLNGAKTAAGVSVAPENSLRSVAVLACVRLLSESVGTLPLLAYRRLTGGGRERASEWSLYPLLHAMPNPEISAAEFWSALVSHVELWGNAYAEIEFNNAGQVSALWPLRPGSVTVSRSPDSGDLRYDVALNGGTTVRLPAYRVMHLRGPGLNGLYGLSVIQQARQAVGLALAAEEFGARFFGNGAVPGVVLTYPGRDLSDKARANMKSSWRDQHEGLSNAQRVAILEDGVKIERIGIPPNDSQFIETRRFQIAEIARMFGVPLHMLAEMEAGASYASVEQRSLEFLTLSLRPRLVRIEQAIYRSLLTPAERRTYFAEFKVDGLLRGDQRTRYAAYVAGLQWGFLSINEVRELENMNPVNHGDEYLRPLNMTTLDAASTVDALLGDGAKGGKSNGKG